VAALTAVTLAGPNDDAAGAVPDTSSEGARIDTPANGVTVDGSVEIKGQAVGPNADRFSFYRVLIGRGDEPPHLRPLGDPYDKPVANGVLAVWDTSRFPPGLYRLGLAIYDLDGNVSATSVLVTVAAKPTP